jgi:preprotein translocase subunit YajC
MPCPARRISARRRALPRIQCPLLCAADAASSADSRLFHGAAEPRARSALLTFLFSLLETLLFISSAFAQTAPAASGGGDMLSSLGSMLPLVLMFVVLYFVMIRPQMKRQKEARAMIEALAKGDEVATAGGVLGKITSIGDQYLGLEIANGIEIKIQRSAVVQVLPKGAVK